MIINVINSKITKINVGNKNINLKQKIFVVYQLREIENVKHQNATM